MIRINTVKEFIWQVADQFGEHEAYAWREGGGIVTRSYTDLNNDVSGISRQIHRTVGEERHIAIIGEKSYYWMCMFYGIITSANVVVPIDVKLSPKDMTDRLDFADVSIVFLSDKFSYLKDDIKEACPKVDRIFIISEYIKEIPDEALNEPLLMVYPDQLSLLLFTSGTTGNGFKAAMITQGSLLSGVRDYAPIYRPGGRVLSVLPLHHCFELFLGQMKASYSGTTIYINDDITGLMRDFSEFKPDSMVVVPAIAKIICSVIIKAARAGSMEEARRMLGGSLKFLAIGGAASGPEMIATLYKGGIRAYNGYGLTESSGGCLINLETQSSPEACGLNPYGNVDIKIKDGELMLSGPYIAKGYYKQPELTAKVFENGWLHTGDMARLNDEGKVIILGRKDNMINLANGEKVYPEQWEDRIAAMEGVRAGMVCAIDDHLAAVLQLADNSDKVKSHITGLIDKINATLPGYDKIMDVRFREAPFPMTSSMKIKRAEVIKELSDEQIRSALYVPPKNDSQAMIIERIRQVLPDAKEIGITDNLYEKGLDSLTTLNLALLLSCSPTVIYECKTVEKISEKISVKGKTDLDHLNLRIKKQGINDVIKNTDENAPWNKEGAILITGATGYLGPHIIKELIKLNERADINEPPIPDKDTYNRKIYCLVRSRERFIKTCEYYGVSLPSDKDIYTALPIDEASPAGALHVNIEPVTGDLTSENFGLSDDEYELLCDEVTVVFHCAASVAHAGSMEESYRINVGGTEEVLKFCLSSGAQLYHMSSYAVTGFNTDKPLTEDVLDIGQQITQNPYVQTKYQAEECVLAAREKGVASTIFRIGNLTKRKSDGLFQINADENGLAAQIRALNKLGVYPANMSDVCYDDTPVDKAAEAVVTLAVNDGTGSIWHIMSTNIKGIPELSDAKEVAEEEFIKRLTENGDDRDVAMLSIYYRMNKDGFNSKIDLSKTLGELNRLGFEW